MLGSLACLRDCVTELGFNRSQIEHSGRDMQMLLFVLLATYYYSLVAAQSRERLPPEVFDGQALTSSWLPCIMIIATIIRLMAAAVRPQPC